MSEVPHRECFGTMFPDALHLQNDRPQRGKVFSILLQRSGGMMLSDRSIAADIAQWDDCRACAEFESCYKFCTAKLLLSSALAGE